MNGRAVLGGVVVLAAIFLGVSRFAHAPGTDALRPLGAEERHAQDDPFPLDGQVRVYETRQRRVGDGMLLYEARAVGTQRLADGRDYVVVETQVRTRGAPRSRLVTREWYRREGTALLCSRRQEGPVIVDLVPAQEVLSLPLEVGKRWSWSGTAAGRPCRMECTVASCERVIVGAGTFENAWRIDSEVYSDKETDEVRRSTFFQPGLGVVEERALIRTEQRAVRLDAALVSIAPYRTQGSN